MTAGRLANVFLPDSYSVGEIDFRAQTPRNLRLEQGSFLNSPTLSDSAVKTLCP